MNEQSVRILSRYIPPASVGYVVQCMDKLPVKLTISRPRKTKLGDYRPPFTEPFGRKKGHRISVNNDLNQYAFLLTLVHEIAHAYNFAENGTRVAPHGQEWKAWFNRLMQPLLNPGVFPNELLPRINLHLQNIKSTSCGDEELTRSLKAYDRGAENLVFLCDLPEDAVFTWRNGKKFKKLQKLRKRYRCKEIDTSRIYLFSPVAEVQVFQ